MEWTGRRRRRIGGIWIARRCATGTSLQRFGAGGRSSTTGRKVLGLAVDGTVGSVYEDVEAADREKDGIVRWRRVDLKSVIAEEFGVDFLIRAMSGKLLKKLGFSHVSARPRHPAQDERIVEEFKKTSRARFQLIAGLSETMLIEIWFQDEARIGQKNGPPQPVGQAAETGDQDSPPISATTTPICSARSAQRKAGAALALPLCRHRHDATPPRRNLEHRRQGRTRRGASDEGRVAHH